MADCSACDINGVCIKCTNEYYVFDKNFDRCIEQQCLLPNCQKCKVGSNMCESCAAGYAYYPLTMTCIKSPITNCLSVHDWRGFEFVCSSCSSVYKPSHDQTECIVKNTCSVKNCQFCTGSTCDQCRIGYKVDANNAC